jgi:hypothetical protein
MKGVKKGKTIRGVRMQDEFFGWLDARAAQFGGTISGEIARLCHDQMEREREVQAAKARAQSTSARE